MDKFATNLLLTLISVPLVVGVLCLVIPQKFSRFVFLLHFMIHFIALLTLPFVGDILLAESVNFLGYPITFSISTTAIAIYLIAMAALLFNFLIQLSQSIEILNTKNILILEVSLAMGSVALFSGQFMIRYIALELVGLMIAASALTEIPAFHRFSKIFLWLRMGDLGLLAAILLLSMEAETLDISLMIEKATVLPLQTQYWILGGFLLAILIKLGIVPLNGWMQEIQHQPQLLQWCGMILMPSLGYYLLIRIAPIIHSQATLQYLVAAIIFLLILIGFLARSTTETNFYWNMNSILGCFAVLMAAYVPYIILREYILIILGFRVFISLSQITTIPFQKILTAIIPVLANLVFLIFIFGEGPQFFSYFWVLLSITMTIWITVHLLKQDKKGMEPSLESLTHPNHQNRTLTNINDWFYQNIEINILNAIFPQIERWLIISTDWLLHSFESRITGLWQESGKQIMSISEKTLHLENNGVEKLSNNIQKILNRIQVGETQRRNLDIRWDLVWIPVILLFILAFLLIV